MKPEIRDEMLQAFSRFPDYQFIWKLTKVDETIINVIKKYSNVNVFSWIQQTSILNHSKTRAFISHMGLNSYNEATYYGVPIVSMACFGDQTLNSAMAVRRGVAVYVSKKKINAEVLTNALNEILYTPKYRENALNLKEKLLNFPQNSAETFVKHVEFAERFGSLDELRLDTAGESIFEQFFLDLIGVCLLFLVISYLIIITLLRQMILLVKTQLLSVKTNKID
jgi:UDP-N-acetylglucosamine:LPS N-acetylglucosamine transferase